MVLDYHLGNLQQHCCLKSAKQAKPFLLLGEQITNKLFKKEDDKTNCCLHDGELMRLALAAQHFHWRTNKSPTQCPTWRPQSPTKLTTHLMIPWKSKCIVDWTRQLGAIFYVAGMRTKPTASYRLLHNDATASVTKCVIGPSFSVTVWVVDPPS